MTEPAVPPAHEPVLPARAATAVLGLVLVVLAAAFAYQLWPFVRYPYEADPSDGDMLNALGRGLAGLPIYGNWREGTVTLLYPPLFLGVLGLGRLVGLDPIVFFRTVNLVLLLGSLAATVILGSGDGERRSGFALPGALAAIFVMAAWQQYFWIAPVHPAALLLALTMAVCVVLIFRPTADLTLAVLCVAAILSKQAGLALAVAVAIHLAGRDRRRLLRFVILAAALTGAAVALLEWQSRGQFLRSVLFYPGRAFSGPWLSWGNGFVLAAGYYGGRLWLLPLIVAGLWSVRGTRLAPLATVFLVDALCQIYLARSLAGSPSYLWVHYALASVLAARGWCWLLLLLARRMAAPAGAWLTPALAAAVGLFCLGSDGRALLGRPRHDLAPAAAIGARHTRLVASVAAENPGKKWIVTRSSLAAVRAGVILDQEYATFAIAWTHPTLIDRDLVRRRVARGDYTFVQLAPTDIGFNPLGDLFARCFVAHAESSIVFMGKLSPTTILRYDGEGAGCRDPLRPAP